MLGPRVNSLSVGGLLRRFRPVDRRADAAERGRAGSGSRTASCAARSRCSSRRSPVLLLVGIPFLRLQQGVPGAEVYPPGVESRDAWVALQTEFPPARRRRSSSSPTCRARPTDAPRPSRRSRAYGDELAGARRHRPRRGPVLDHATRRPAPPMTPEQVAAAVRAAGRPAAAGPRRAPPAQYIRGGTVRLDAISPLVAVAAGGHGPDPDDPRGRRRRPAITMQVGGAAAHRRGLPRVAVGARPVGRRADAARERPDPVPAVRLARDPDQGGRHDPAVAHGELRRPRLDLPGGQPHELLNFEPARLHHRGQPDHHVRRPDRPVDGLRGPAPVADPGGVPADRRQHRRRSPRASPGPPASSPARR